MSITEKYVEFILGYIGNSSLVQLDEPKEGNMVAYHKLGPVITVNVDMKVLSTYSRSANILLTFDKYNVERLFFMPLNSSPVSISNKINKEIDNEVLRALESCPKWTPGSMRGVNVKQYYTLPLKIVITPSN